MPRVWEKESNRQWDQKTGNIYSNQRNKEYMAKLFLVSTAAVTVKRHLQKQQNQQLHQEQNWSNSNGRNFQPNVNYQNCWERETNFQGDGGGPMNSASDYNNYQQNSSDSNGPNFQQNINYQNGKIFQAGCGSSINNPTTFDNYSNSSSEYNNFDFNNLNNNKTKNFLINTNNFDNLNSNNFNNEICNFSDNSEKDSLKKNFNSAQIRKNPVLNNSEIGIGYQQPANDEVETKYSSQWRMEKSLNYKHFDKEVEGVQSNVIEVPKLPDHNSTSGEKILKWREYREKMKPILNREFVNARRSIQRLEKLPYESLNEKQRFRLSNAKEAINWHRKHKSICNPSVRMPAIDYGKQDG